MLGLICIGKLVEVCMLGLACLGKFAEECVCVFIPPPVAWPSLSYWCCFHYVIMSVNSTQCKFLNLSFFFYRCCTFSLYLKLSLSCTKMKHRNGIKQITVVAGPCSLSSGLKVISKGENVSNQHKNNYK